MELLFITIAMFAIPVLLVIDICIKHSKQKNNTEILYNINKSIENLPTKIEFEEFKKEIKHILKESKITSSYAVFDEKEQKNIEQLEENKTTSEIKIETSPLPKKEEIEKLPNPLENIMPLYEAYIKQGEPFKYKLNFKLRDSNIALMEGIKLELSQFVKTDDGSGKMYLIDLINNNKCILPRKNLKLDDFEKDGLCFFFKRPNEWKQGYAVNAIEPAIVSVSPNGTIEEVVKHGELGHI